MSNILSNYEDIDQEITVDFEVDEVLDIQLGMIYQGEPMSSGLKNTHLNIRTVEYTVVTW